MKSGSATHKRDFSIILKRYLDPALDFRVRLFNVLAIGGTSISLLVAIFGMIVGSGTVNVITSLCLMALSFSLLTFSYKTGRYQLCYMITITGIFMCLFPVLFFSAGGYHSGMPAFFVFAVAFTVFMLEGNKAIFFSIAELVLYIAICFIAFAYPQTVNFYTSEQDVFADIIVAFTVVSIVLGICLFLHFRLYNEQQRKLDRQNDLLAEISRSKTEFLANTSHEMRTPLTVVSVNVQTVMGILKQMGESVNDPEITELLGDAQSEIMRTARMVGGMLTLSSLRENTEKSMVDLSVLLRSTADMLQLVLNRRGNTLETDIADGMAVYADADLLAQVAVNIIQNAHAHTANDILRLCAARDGEMITVSVADNGSGIAPELLPRVFERGVSGKDGDGGGTGVGLFLCKTVVESHGGRIWVESEPGKGTTVSFTLPVHAGQMGG
ncbi:MAG: HAMP domain-containing histidine kinase [Oscillospiraceae bacterium]|jgi:signal transduction histidine kinase|nr:HAMP domain-containing histidine kinase [Oscillospiraceae bacterium]